jgi:electron transport complex protein RnfG
MREMIRLLVTIAIFSAVSGGLLTAIQSGTKERIEYQQLKFVKGPTIQQILEGCSNDPLVDRFKLVDGKEQISFFVGVFDNKANTVALESFGKGFSGDIGVIVAVNTEDDKTEAGFSAQFKGLPVKEPLKVKADGGQIDALSGATISSRGVCGAVVDSAEIYARLKKDIMEKLKAFKK